MELQLTIIGHPRILNSVFINNTGGEDYVGGNLLIVSNQNCSDVQSNTSLNANSFTIQSSHILHGYTPQANTRHSTGLDIRVYDSCLGFNIKVENVTFSQNGRKNNSATEGGNLHIDVVHRENPTAMHHIIINNSRIEGGRALAGGGVFIRITGNSPRFQCRAAATSKTNEIIISNTNVSGNVAYDTSGGIYISTNVCSKYTIEIRGVIFIQNTAIHGSAGNLGFFFAYS